MTAPGVGVGGVRPSGFFRVLGWEDYQHYRDRNPPWIKLHQKLLDNYGYTRLHDASKAHLLGIFLLAARHGNRVPADPVYIASRLSSTEPVNLQVLVDAGFIEMEPGVVHGASVTLAKRSPETETETETDVPHAVGDAAPPAPVRISWPAEVAAALSLVGPVTPGRAGKALADFARTNPHVQQHGLGLLALAAASYAKHVTGLPREKIGFVKHPAEFFARAGYWVDQVRPGGAAELVERGA